jgi:hypothetical protein
MEQASKAINYFLENKQKTPEQAGFDLATKETSRGAPLDTLLTMRSRTTAPHSTTRSILQQPSKLRASLSPSRAFQTTNSSGKKAKMT